MTDWYVYMVRCSDNSLYTGITVDLCRRIDEHNCGGLTAARYTRARRPVKLVYQERLGSRSEASRREYEMKQLSKQEKEALLA